MALDRLQVFLEQVIEQPEVGREPVVRCREEVAALSLKPLLCPGQGRRRAPDRVQHRLLIALALTYNAQVLSIRHHHDGRGGRARLERVANGTSRAEFPQ